MPLVAVTKSAVSVASVSPKGIPWVVSRANASLTEHVHVQM